jgi:eukaryotic-like serine/threonine-protein kinase
MLDKDQLQSVQALLCAAEAMPPGSARSVWLRQQSSDPWVIEEVESLLASDPPPAFLEPLLRPPAEAEAGQMFGPWRLERRIGRGGRGTVFLASRQDGVFQRNAAVKVLDGHTSPLLVDRLHRESAMLARLDHPNLVRLLDAGTTATRLSWLAMDYVEGKRCSDWAASHGHNPDEVVRLMLDLCAALQAAHAQLVSHRDLKPSNILVTPDGQPRVLDFGEARLTEGLGESHTHTGLRGFTVNYASPEQILGQPPSTADDVYALGIVLFEMLCGHVPRDLSGLSLPDLLRFAQSGSGPQSAPPPTVPPDLIAISAKAAALDPAARYNSVQALAEDLRRYVAYFPIQARRPGPIQRAGMFMRRNRAPLAAALLLLLLLSLGIGMVLRSARQARQLQAAAELQRQEAELQRQEADKQRQLAEQQRQEAEQQRSEAAQQRKVAEEQSRQAANSATAAEAGRRSAIDRFNDLRSLAAALIYQLEPEARNVPGTTALRQKMIAQGVTYLDKLSQSLVGNPGDADIWTEVADAWYRLAVVQGGINNTYSLGDSQAALSSFRKALAARERRAQLLPGDREALRMLEEARISLAAQLRGLQKYAEANALLAQADSNLSLLLLSRRDDDTLRSLARVRFYTDRLSYRALSDELLARQPNSPQELRNAALAYKYTVAGEAVSVRLANARRALEIDHRRLQIEPANPEIQLDLSFDWSSIATCQLHLGQFLDAVSAFQQAVSLRRSLAAADPQNIRFRERLAAGLTLLGEALIYAKDWEAVRRAAREALSLSRSLPATYSPRNQKGLAGNASGLLALDPATPPEEACRLAQEYWRYAADDSTAGFFFIQPRLKSLRDSCNAPQ